MSVMTESGRAALALAVKNQAVHLAWGTGDESWENEPPPPNIDATTLINEIGRTPAWVCLFVLPDDEGEILLPNNSRYSISPNPTRHLYMNFKFDFSDGVGSTIRELGVFIGTEIKETVPAGQRYLLPSDIEDSGVLFQLEYREPLVRLASERVEMQWVISL